MMQKFESAPVIIGVVFISFFVAALLVSADWTAPLATPPTCAAGNPGCDPPVNTGGAGQVKTGGLTVASQPVTGNVGFTVLNGNVGIGTAAPTQKLDIAGDVNISGTSPALYFNETDQTDPAGQWRMVAGAQTFSIRKKTTAGTWAGEESKIAINSAGNVVFKNASIGTDIINDIPAGGVSISATRRRLTDPFTVLSGDDVLYVRGYAYDGNSNEEVARITFDTEGAIADESIPGMLKFYTASAANPSVVTLRMTINSSGDVGIGTAAPTEKLHVNGNITADKVFNPVYAP